MQTSRRGLFGLLGAALVGSVVAKPLLSVGDTVGVTLTGSVVTASSYWLNRKTLDALQPCFRFSNVADVKMPPARVGRMIQWYMKPTNVDQNYL